MFINLSSILIHIQYDIFEDYSRFRSWVAQFDLDRRTKIL